MSEKYIHLHFPTTKNQKLQPCDSCRMTKSHKVKINKQARTETEPKEICDVLMSDLKTMPTVGTGGCKYIGTIIDKKSRYTLQVYLSTKDKFYHHYQSVITWIKNQTGKAHKVFLSDNGGEFKNSNMDDLHRAEGISHITTPPYTPAKNGIAERFNRTLIEAVCAMLHHAGMSAKYWVECSKYFLYMKNRTPHSKLNYRTPYEVFHKRLPHAVSYLTFGALGYFHIEKRSKSMTTKAKRCCILGIDSSNRYIGKCLVTGDIITSDTVTEEDTIFPLGKHKNIVMANIDHYNEREIKELTDDDEEELETLRENELWRQEDNTAPAIEKNVSSIPNLSELLPKRLLLGKNQPIPNLNENLSPPQTNKNIIGPQLEENKYPQPSEDGVSVSTSSPSEKYEKSSISPQTSPPRPKIHQSEEKDTSNPFSKYGIPTFQEATERWEEKLSKLNYSPKVTPTRPKGIYEQEERTEDDFSCSVPSTTLRRSQRTIVPSHEKLISIANAPMSKSACIQPNNTDPTETPTGRISHQDLEGIANAIAAGKPIPQSYQQAQMSPQWPKWKEAITKEIAAIRKAETLEHIQQLPAGAKAIRCRWVFKIKPENAQEPEIYKARLVAQGFRQKEGIDYNETFAAVAKMTSFRLLIALAAVHRARLTKLDVSSAFLMSDIDTDVFIHPPEGFPQIGFFRLRKALYGLKQSPRLWANTLSAELKLMGFISLTTDSCIYKHKTSKTYILVVVDDIIISTNDENLRQTVERRLHQKFCIKVFDEVKTFIGIQVQDQPTAIKLHQQQFIEELLDRFDMTKCTPVSTPAKATPDADGPLKEPLDPTVPYRQLVGSLIYLLATRPEIAASVVELSRHLNSPTVGNFIAAKRILRYLAGTSSSGVTYQKGYTSNKILCYSDSDWAGCKTTRRSVSGYVIYFAGGPIAWKSKMQTIVAQSSCEAEYIALGETVKEILWLIQHFKELDITLEPTFIFGDNTASIALAKNPVNHQRTKHIDIRHHFLRYHVKAGTIKLLHISTKDNVADLLTKITSAGTFESLAPSLVNAVVA